MNKARYGDVVRLPTLTLDHVWVISALALMALRPLLTPVPPHDFWWHMATGRLIVETGTIPTVDSFSYTQTGEPFANQGWLAQVFMYSVHEIGGVALLVFVQALVIALAYGLLLWLCIRRSGTVRLSVALLLLTIMPMSFDNWHIRPQSYAFPLFVAFLVVLTTYRESRGINGTPMHWQWLGRGWLWLLPILMVLWVNVHGSFVLGGVLIALTFIGEGIRRTIARWRGHDESDRAPLWPLVVWGAITALAMLLNPMGVGILSYVTNLVGNSAVRMLVTEWAPPTTRDLGGTIFFLFLMIMVLVIAYARRPPDPIDLLIAAPFFWLALGAVRNIVWFGIVTTPLMVMQSASWFERSDGQPASLTSRSRARGVPLLNGLLVGMMGLLVLLGLPWVKPAIGLPPEVGNLLSDRTPVAAVAALQSGELGERPRHLFHDMGYGSYLIWQAPEQPVFIDPRIELYPYEQWQEYIMLGSGRAVDEVIDRYEIDGLLLHREAQSGLIDAIANNPRWEQRYEDETTVYFRIKQR